MTHVIYHHDDPDGHVAAAVLAQYLLKKNPRADIRFFAKQYTDTFMDHMNLDDAVSLYFLDLSFTDKTKDKIIESAKSLKSKESYLGNDEVIDLVWIDHHASSGTAVGNIYEEIMKLEMKNVITKVMFFTELSGCALTYLFTKILEDDRTFRDVDCLIQNDDCISFLDVDERYYHNDEYLNNVVYNGKHYSIPSFIYHVDNYDRWTKEDPIADAFITGLKLKGYQVGTLAENMNPIYKEDPSDWVTNDIVNDGIVALKYQKQVYLEQADLIGIIQLNNYKVAYKISPGNSWNFNDLLDNNEVDFAILVRYDPAFNLWIHSFFGNAKLTFQVNKLAEALGGGGHPGAAGCQIDDILPIHPEDVFKKYPEASNILFDIDPEVEETPMKPPMVYVSGTPSEFADDGFDPRTVITEFFDSEFRNYSCDGIVRDSEVAYESSLEDEEAKSMCKYHIYLIAPNTMRSNPNLFFEIGESIASNDTITKVFVCNNILIEKEEEEEDSVTHEKYTNTKYINKKLYGSETVFVDQFRHIYPDSICICDNESELMFNLGNYCMKIAKEIKANN